MASWTWPPSSASHIVLALRCLVAISYFALIILFYARAPSAADPAAAGFPSLPPRFLKSATNYRSVGAFGDVMIAMLGSPDVPFTIFVPSHTAFLKVSSIFRRLEEKGEQVDLREPNSDAYAVMSHLLSFSAVPKPIFSKHVPVDQEVLYESLSGFLLSLTRVPGRGLLVNNLTCAVTDLQKGRFVIHVLNGAVMDFAFEQSFVHDAVPADQEDTKELEAEEEGHVAEAENKSHV